MGIDEDSRVERITVRSIDPAPPSTAPIQTPREDPFDIGLPLRMRTVTIHLVPGVGAEWATRRELACTLRSRLGIGTGAPDVEVVSPDAMSGAWAHVGADGTIEVGETVDRVAWPPPEDRKAELRDLKVTRVNRGFREPDAPLEIRFEGQLRNLTHTALSGLSVRVRPYPEGEPAWTFPVAEAIPPLSSIPFAVARVLAEGESPLSEQRFEASILLSGRELPAFDTVRYVHDLDWLGVRRDTLEKAGLVPLLDERPGPGIPTQGLPVHKALCASPGFSDLSPDETEAGARAVWMALRDHAQRFGEGVGTVEIRGLNPRDPRKCDQVVGVITETGTWMAWETR